MSPHTLLLSHTHFSGRIRYTLCISLVGCNENCLYCLQESPHLPEYQIPLLLRHQDCTASVTGGRHFSPPKELVHKPRDHQQQKCRRDTTAFHSLDSGPLDDACLSACRYPSIRQGLDLIIREIATRIFRPWIASESPCTGTTVAATDQPMGAFGATPSSGRVFCFRPAIKGSLVSCQISGKTTLFDTAERIVPPHGVGMYTAFIIDIGDIDTARIAAPS